MQDNGSLPEVLVEHVTRRLLTLGQPMRLRIVARLGADGEMTVQALADALGATQQNTSRHLGVLHRERIVDRRQAGRVVWYWLSDSTAMRLIDQAGEHVVHDLQTRGAPW